MKVLNISTSSLFYNGIGIVLLNYYQNMYNDKIQMDYISPGYVDQDYKKEISIKGNKVFEFEYKGQKIRQKRPIKYCFKLYNIIKKEKYDIVHVHGSSSMMAMDLLVAKLAGTKIRIAHSHNTQSDNKILNMIFRPIFMKSYTHAFACGEEAGKWLFGQKSNFTIIPNGKDCELYEYNEKIRKKIRKKFRIPDNNIVIGHVGNFNEQKNHEYLLKIFKELSDNYRLLLVGSGELQEEIVSFAKKMNIYDRIIFTGSVPSDMVAKIIQAMDIIVFPSKFEGFPNVLIEWQISGLPCLISDKITKSVNLTNLVKFLSINENPKVWAQEINKTKILDREKNNLMIRQAIINAGYDIKENAKRLEQLYLDLKKEEFR
ncbi:MAG: glycosyltransferase family 1 protein [Erysipelotrichales bacterium]|nr:glycosyltransferase family 1 protein [Erysipelotrichales bacterium]